MLMTFSSLLTCGDKSLLPCDYFITLCVRLEIHYSKLLLLDLIGETLS